MIEGRAAELLADLGVVRPLSESPLWRLHEDYFRRQGVAAWTSGDVPHLLTNSPMVGRAYAQVIEGVIEDCLAGRFGPLERSQPIYVVELGAGIGRLAYNVLRSLMTDAGGPPVVYVLTDAFESNLAFWRSHPRLAPLLEAGCLDLGHYDLDAGGELVLERSQRVLRPGELANPLVVVANYVFDVLRQDLYLIESGQLREELVALDHPEALLEQDVEIGSADFFRRLLLRVEALEVGPDRYGASELDAVLAEIAAERSGQDCRFLFPAQALRALRQLVELAAGRLVLLLGERPGEAAQPEVKSPAENPATREAEQSENGRPGARRLDARQPDGARPAPSKTQAPAEVAVEGRPPSLPAGVYRPGHLLAMGVHGGSISLPVDLDILSRVVSRQGGVLLLPDASPAGILVGACIVGDGGLARATRRRFTLAVDEGGPEDLFLSLRAMLERGTDELPLSMALALLRVGGYDAHLFRQLHGRLAQLLPGADAASVEEAVRVMREVWARFYPIDDRTDLAFGIAALLAPAGRVSDALEFLGYSHAHAPTPLGSYNTALCHLLLGDEAAARQALEEALSLDPELDEALALQQKMRERAEGGDLEAPGA